MIWARNFPKSAIIDLYFLLKRDILSEISFSQARISKMVSNGVLKPFCVGSTLEILWENQNDLGQKFAKVFHYGIAFA